MADLVPNIQCTVRGILINNPRKFDETRGGYKVQILLDDESVKKLKEVKDKTLTNKFGNANKKVTNYLCQLGDDDKYAETFGRHFIISRPRKGEMVPCLIKTVSTGCVTVPENEVPLKFYRGAHVALSIDVYAQDAIKTKDRTSNALITSCARALLFVKDGERLGVSSAPLSDSEFGDLNSEIDEGNEEFREDA